MAHHLAKALRARGDWEVALRILAIIQHLADGPYEFDPPGPHALFNDYATAQAQGGRNVSSRVDSL